MCVALHADTLEKNQGFYAQLPSKDVCVLTLLIFPFATTSEYSFQHLNLCGIPCCNIWASVLILFAVLRPQRWFFQRYLSTHICLSILFAKVGKSFPFGVVIGGCLWTEPSDNHSDCVLASHFSVRSENLWRPLRQPRSQPGSVACLGFSPGLLSTAPVGI